MAYQIGTANGHTGLLDAVRRFLTGYATLGTPAFSGTGPGTITGVDTATAGITETWTIACTDATTPGAELWSVTGSVSGAQAGATTGVAYSISKLAFTITGSGYAVGAQFTIASTRGQLATLGQAWAQNRWTTAGDYELWLQGPGLAGTDEIFMGLRSYQNVGSDYYNLALAGATGFVTGNTWASQPGHSGDRGVALWNGSIPYWIRANGRCAVVAAKVATVYASFYFGKYLPYQSPGQYPYPVAVSAMLGSASATRYSDTSASHSMGFKGSSSRMVQRWIDGSWITPDCRPWMGGSPAWRDSGGAYPLQPIILNSSSGNYGELDGVYHCPVFGGNAVEDIITVGGVQHVLIQDLFRTGVADMIAIRLD